MASWAVTILIITTGKELSTIKTEQLITCLPLGHHFSKFPDFSLTQQYKISDLHVVAASTRDFLQPSLRWIIFQQIFLLHQGKRLFRLQPPQMFLPPPMVNKSYYIISIFPDVSSKCCLLFPDLEEFLTTCIS